MNPAPPPPQPLPENLWGERWQFVTLPAEDLEQGLLQRPIPHCYAPEMLLPSTLNLAPAIPIPGVIIEAGRRSLKLAQWIQDQQPTYLGSVLAELNGLLLHTQSQQRWVLMTYENAEIAAAAKQFESQKLISNALHFLMVQPDDSGCTQAGVWLLRNQAKS